MLNDLTTLKYPNQTHPNSGPSHALINKQGDYAGLCKLKKKKENLAGLKPYKTSLIIFPVTPHKAPKCLAV